MDTAAVFGTEMHDGIKVIFGDTCDVKFPRAVRDKWSWAELSEPPEQEQSVLRKEAAHIEGQNTNTVARSPRYQAHWHVNAQLAPQCASIDFLLIFSSLPWMIVAAGANMKTFRQRTWRLVEQS